MRDLSTWSISVTSGRPGHQANKTVTTSPEEMTMKSAFGVVTHKQPVVTRALLEVGGMPDIYMQDALVSDSLSSKSVRSRSRRRCRRSLSATSGSSVMDR